MKTSLGLKPVGKGAVDGVSGYLSPLPQKTLVGRYFWQAVINRVQ